MKKSCDITMKSIDKSTPEKKSAENSKNSFNFPTSYLVLFNPHAEVKFP